MNTATKLLVVWDAEGERVAQGEVIYLWADYAEAGSTRSLMRYIEEHGDRLRSRYMAWIHDLGETRIGTGRVLDHLVLEEGLSYWWLTHLAEKNPWKSPIVDAIRLLALEEIIVRESPGRVRLASVDPRLHEALQGLCQRLGIPFSGEGRRPWWRFPRGAGARHRTLPHPLQALIYIVRHVVTRWPLRQGKAEPAAADKPGRFFCSYFDNVDPKAAGDARFHSYYWGKLPAILDTAGRQSRWLQLYVPCAAVPSTGLALNWIKGFNRHPPRLQAHAFLDAYLSGRILWRVLGAWLRLQRRSSQMAGIQAAFTPQGSQVSLWPILEESWKTSLTGTAAISNLLSLELFDEALRNLPPQAKGFYLCENQGWERAMIQAWRKHGHGTLVAVVHSTARFWDLRYFFDPRTFTSVQPHRMPQADRFVLNGKAMMASFRQAGYPAELLAEGEALRYGYLEKFDVPGKRSAGEPRGEAMLILGDFMLSSTMRLLQLLEAAAAHLPVKRRYVIKPHPNCPIAPDAFPALNLTQVNEPLADILQDYDTAYASKGTSAVVDAYLAGLNAIVMLDGGDLNFSPLRGHAGVRFVGSAAELAEALQAPAGVNPDRTAADDYFFLDPQLPRWTRLLAD